MIDLHRSARVAARWSGEGCPISSIHNVVRLPLLETSHASIASEVTSEHLLMFNVVKSPQHESRYFTAPADRWNHDEGTIVNVATQTYSQLRVER